MTGSSNSVSSFVGNENTTKILRSIFLMYYQTINSTTKAVLFNVKEANNHSFSWKVSADLRRQYYYYSPDDSVDCKLGMVSQPYVIGAV